MPVTLMTIILTVTLLYLIYWWLQKRANYWKERGIPHAECLPLIGSMKPTFKNKAPFGQVIADLYKQFDGEKFFGMNVFTTPVLVIRDLEMINQVLIKDFGHFIDRNHPPDENLELFNASVASLTGNKWKALRHKLTPTFSSGKLRIMFNKMKDCSEEAVLVLKKRMGQDIDSRDFIFKYMMNVIGDVAFGVNVDAFNEEKEKENLFFHYSKKIFEPSSKLSFGFLAFTVAPKLRELFRIKIGDNDSNTFFNKFIKDLMNYRQKSNTKRNDFFQLMLNEKQKEMNIFSSERNRETDPEEETACLITNELDDLELTDNLRNVNFDQKFKVFSDNIIAAQSLVVSSATETTAGMLSFALYELSVNRDIQIRAQDEIDAVLETQEFSYESLKKMTYLDQILNEVLRLRTPCIILNRICTKDYRLPGTDIIIKKGSSVSVPVIGIHRDPQYYPDPETFNPDRFQNMDNIPKGVFLPFGGGPRICIAMRLAMLKMKVFLATLLLNYNIILSDKTKTPLRLDVRSVAQHVEGGIWIRFEKKTNSV